MFTKFFSIISGLLVGIVTFLSVLKGLLPSFIAPLAMGVYVAYILRVYSDD